MAVRPIRETGQLLGRGNPWREKSKGVCRLKQTCKAEGGASRNEGAIPWIRNLTRRVEPSGVRGFLRNGCAKRHEVSRKGARIERCRARASGGNPGAELNRRRGVSSGRAEQYEERGNTG